MCVFRECSAAYILQNSILGAAVDICGEKYILVWNSYFNIKINYESKERDEDQARKYRQFK